MSDPIPHFDNGPSGCGPWAGFLIVYLIICLFYPPAFGIGLGIAGFTLAMWLVCFVLFGNRQGPPFS